jgi:hypothetical protein
VKKIIKPAEKEEAIYFTDFKGKSCGEFGAPVEVKISFNYGSKHDGDFLVLDLDDEEIEPFLKLIKQHMSEDYKKLLRDKLSALEKSYETSLQCRDWTSCEYESNSLSLLEYMVGSKEDL